VKAEVCLTLHVPIIV